MSVCNKYTKKAWVFLELLSRKKRRSIKKIGDTMDKKEAEKKLGVRIENCPCCGGSNLTVGVMSFSERGVNCNHCSLNMRREIPEYFDADLMGESAQHFTLRFAIMAWNRRETE